MTAETRQLSVEAIALANGATLLYNPVDTAPRLALSFFLPGGNTLEATPGLADMVDRLLLKGTETRDQEQLAIDLDGLTLDLDTDTKRDYSLLSATLLEEDLEASLDIIADVFYNATLDEFAKEKERTAGEIAMELDSPRNRVSDLLVRNLFEGTPYNVVSSVVLDNLPLLESPAQAMMHYHQVYQPQRMVISAAGNIAKGRLVSLLEHYFSERRAGVAPLPDMEYVAETLRAHAVPENRTVAFARDDSNQTHIIQGWLAPDIRHPDCMPLVVMNTLLGAGGLSSRLFIELRDKQGLAYTVRSVYDAYRHKGMFYLYIGTEPANREKCLAGFRTECEKLMNEAVSAQELAETQRNILGRRQVFLETAPQQAGFIGSNVILGRTLEEIQEIPERILAVTADDIQRVAQAWLSRPSLTAIVGPS